MLQLPFEKIAGPYALFLHAHAIVAHSGHVLIPSCLYEPGDFISCMDRSTFRRHGLLQLTPLFIFENYGRGSFPVADTDTYPEMEIKAGASFYEKWLDKLDLDATVQSWKVTVAAYQRGTRDRSYLQRWDAAWNGLKGKPNGRPTKPGTNP